MNPKVSIILPTYNGARWISSAIESVLAQYYSDWELLVIDDGSTDGTDKIILDFCDKDPRVIYVKNEKNMGLQKTLNKGINLAKGEYIARIDDDDRWCDTDKLKDQIEFFEKNNEYVLVGTGVIVVGDDNQEIFRYLNPETDKNIRKIFLKRNPFVHSSVVFKKDMVFKMGLYGEDGSTKHIEDYDLWLRLARTGKVHNLPKYSVVFMSRAQNITQKNRAYQFRKIISLIKRNKDFYPNYFISFIFAYARLLGFGIFRILPKFLRDYIFNIYKNI